MSQRMSQLDVDRQNAKVFNARMNKKHETNHKSQSAVIGVDNGCWPDNLLPMTTPYSEQENEKIRSYYSSRDKKPVDLDELARIVGRTRWSVAMQSSRLGLCDPNRPKAESHKANFAIAQKKRFQNPSEKKKASIAATEWHKNNEHPRGMLGKKHTESSKALISAANTGAEVPPERTIRGMKTKLARFGTLVNPRMKQTWKAAWRTIGGKKKYFRSRWEANYARYLEFQKQRGEIVEWLHEPETFWFEKIKRGVRSYIPDFKITQNSGAIMFFEIKGWMDSRSKTKLKRMAKYHPSVRITLIQADWFKKNNPLLRGIIKDWE